MGKVKMTVTVDEALAKEMDALSASRQTNRSRLVEEALRFWHQDQLKQSLIEGYRAMAEEDRQTAEEHLAAGAEILR